MVGIGNHSAGTALSVRSAFLLGLRRGADVDQRAPSAECGRCRGHGRRVADQGQLLSRDQELVAGLVDPGLGDRDLLRLTEPGVVQPGRLGPLPQLLLHRQQVEPLLVAVLVTEHLDVLRDRPASLEVHNSESVGGERVDPVDKPDEWDSRDRRSDLQLAAVDVDAGGVLDVEDAFEGGVHLSHPAVTHRHGERVVAGHGVVADLPQDRHGGGYRAVLAGQFEQLLQHLVAAVAEDGGGEWVLFAGPHLLERPAGCAAVHGVHRGGRHGALRQPGQGRLVIDDEPPAVPGEPLGDDVEPGPQVVPGGVQLGVGLDVVTVRAGR